MAKHETNRCWLCGQLRVLAQAECVTDNIELVKPFVNNRVRNWTFLLLFALAIAFNGCKAGPTLVSQSTDAASFSAAAQVLQDVPATQPVTAAAQSIENVLSNVEKTPLPESSATPPPSATPQPTVAPTLTPSPTPVPTTAPTITPIPSPTTEPDRYCPQPPPLKPEYDRFYLSGNKWPTPDPGITETHFWMAKPLPGGGRLLINQRFPYGWDDNGRYLLHNGVDVAEDLGTPILAVADGTVIVAQSDYSAWYGWRCDWYGHLVVIELDERWLDQPVYALYGHVLNLTVDPGERVVRGQQVADVGVGGAATHPHLHFEVRIGENEFANTRNPMLWLDPGPTRGVIAGRLVDPQGRPWQGVLLALVSEDEGDDILPAWSYLGDPQNLMNPDEGWAENFLFSDIPPGQYQVVTEIQGVQYQQPVEVAAGEIGFLEIVTEPYKTPAPETSAVDDPIPSVTP